MWAIFFISSAFLSLLLVVPGFAFSRFIRFNRLDSFLAAPLFSIALLEIVCVVFSKLGLFVSWINLGISSLILFVIFEVFVIRRLHKKRIETKDKYSYWTKALFLYLFVALLCATFIYVLPLDGPSSFVQDSDNTFHLAVIRSFVDFGDYSTFNVGLYHDFRSSSIVSVTRGFYPAAWHMLAAFVVSFSGQNVAFAANVTNFVMLFLVFPLSMFSLLKAVFHSMPKVVLCGVMLLFAFNGFPWGSMISVAGPIYPNALGLMAMPACAAIFITCVSSKGLSFRIFSFIGFIFGLFALGCCHPNSIFTMAVLLSPFVVRSFSNLYISKTSASSGNVTKFNLVFSWAIPVIVVFAIWSLCFACPALKGTTSFTWDPTASVFQAVVNATTLSFRFPAGNYILALLVFIGFFALLREDDYSWLAFSYLLAVLTYIIGSSTSGFFQHYFAGFWYTDPYRLSANACLIAIPIASFGLFALYSKVNSSLTKLEYKKFSKLTVLVVCTTLLLCGLYIYDFNLPGFGTVYTGLGDYNNCAIKSNDTKRHNLFDSDEQSFCKKVATIMENQKGVIYNNPDDGSAFAYPLMNLNLLYRRSAAEMLGNETSSNKILRLKINELSTNRHVQNILKSQNIKYILDLDFGGQINDDRCYYGYYTWDKWRGINSIDDSTPGLKLLLSEGDMRLYEIDYSSFS